MSMPNIPEVDAKIKLSTKEAANVVLASIGFEELGLAHIINAEGEKIQAFLGTLDKHGRKNYEGREYERPEYERPEYERPEYERPNHGKKEVKIEDLERLDRMVNDTLDRIIKKEFLLLMKLEETKKILEQEKYRRED